MTPQEEPNFVIYVDAENCKACRKCELACIASHNNMTVKEAIKKRKELASRVQVVKTETVKMPVQCRQCEDAVCARICPTQAIIQEDGGKGRVISRDQYCAGCGLCVMACPYGAISKSFVELTEEERVRRDLTEPRYVAARCDLCREWRKKEGKDVTACMEACPGGVLYLLPVEEYRAALRDGAIPPVVQEGRARLAAEAARKAAQKAAEAKQAAAAQEEPKKPAVPAAAAEAARPAPAPAPGRETASPAVPVQAEPKTPTASTATASEGQRPVVAVQAKVVQKQAQHKRPKR